VVREFEASRNRHCAAVLMCASAQRLARHSPRPQAAATSRRITDFQFQFQ
jgi:hypothetical protein